MSTMTIKITRKARAMARAREQIIPKLIGNEVVNFALDNFRRQGFLGDVLEPWRKRKERGKRASTRALLVKSGRGRRSIRVTRADQELVAVGSDVPYMKAHNEGNTDVVRVKEHTRRVHKVEKVGTGKFGKSGKERMRSVKTLSGSQNVQAHTKRMRLPKRQFLGKSQYLLARLKRVYAVEIIRAFNS
ncbi:MAG: phage virion morphogenesis protein [Bacteroidota bacterium]